MVTERRHRDALGLQWNASASKRRHRQAWLAWRSIGPISVISTSTASTSPAPRSVKRSATAPISARANLRHAALRGADLCDADFTDADLSGADLRWCRRGTQEMFDAAKGDAATQLPEGITRPARWEG